VRVKLSDIKSGVELALTREAIHEATSAGVTFSRRIRLVDGKRYPNSRVSRNSRVAYVHVRVLESEALTTFTICQLIHDCVLVGRGVGRDGRDYGSVDKWWDCLNRTGLSESDGTSGHGYYMLLRNYEAGAVVKEKVEPRVLPTPHAPPTKPTVSLSESVDPLLVQALERQGVTVTLT
jgi:hypothetical protein